MTAKQLWAGHSIHPRQMPLFFARRNILHCASCTQGAGSNRYATRSSRLIVAKFEHLQSCLLFDTSQNLAVKAKGIIGSCEVAPPRSALLHILFFCGCSKYKHARH